MNKEINSIDLVAVDRKLKRMSKRPADSIPARLDDLKLRPSERVLQYLLTEFDRSEFQHDTRLPSNRELARRLEVSVPTVQSVLKKLSREGRIQTRHGSGTYLLSQPQKSETPLRVVIAALLRPDEKINDPWLNTIISGFMPVALKSHPTTFVGIAPEKFGTDASVPALLEELPRADGIIIMPYALLPRDRDRVTAAYEAAGKPVVHLNPPAVHATANFVATDYLTSAQTLGRVWRETGRQRIALFAIPEPFEYASSTQLRLMGLAVGIGERLGNSISLEMLTPEHSGEEAAYATMKNLLDQGGQAPDAILVALRNSLPGVLRALQERNLRVPEDVSIVSNEKLAHRYEGDGQVTLIHEPAVELSAKLMGMLMERIENNGRPIPGVYLPINFIGGGSTRDQENKLLGI